MLALRWFGLVLVSACVLAQENPAGAPVTLHVGTGGHLLNAAFLQGGKTVATVGLDGKLRLWDVDTGKERGAAQIGHPTNDHNFRFFEHPDGKRVVVAGAHGKAYVVALDDAKVVTEIPVPGESYPVSFALLDKGATLLRVDRNLTYRRYDTATGKLTSDVQLSKEAGRIEFSSLEFAPDGSTYAINGNGCELRDAVTHAVRYTLKADEKKRHFYRFGVYPARYSADCKLVALHGSDGTLRVVETATGKELRSLTLEERDPTRPSVRRVIAPVAFAPSGQWLLVVGAEGQSSELLLHGVTSGLEVRRFPARSIAPFTRSIALSPQNLLVLPGKGDEVEVWDMATGERLLKARP